MGMGRRSLRTVLASAVFALTLSGCATGTRTASFGPLPGGGKLVTLVVSDDLEVVRRECAELAIFGRVLGCHTSHPVPANVAGRADSAAPVRTIKIVRYAETLPSPATFEIDAHELCHAIAVLQLLEDPCHEGNGGVLQAHGGTRVAAPRFR